MRNIRKHQLRAERNSKRRKLYLKIDRWEGGERWRRYRVQKTRQYGLSPTYLSSFAEVYARNLGFKV